MNEPLRLYVILLKNISVVFVFFYLFLEIGILDAVNDRIDSGVDEQGVNGEMIETATERYVYTHVVEGEVDLIPAPTQHETNAHLHMYKVLAVSEE